MFAALTLYRAMLPARQIPHFGLWLTLDQAAMYSGLSRALLLRAITNKRIRGGKVEGRWMLFRQSVDMFDPMEQLRGAASKLKVLTKDLRGRKRGAA